VVVPADAMVMGKLARWTALVVRDGGVAVPQPEAMTAIARGAAARLTNRGAECLTTINLRTRRRK